MGAMILERLKQNRMWRDLTGGYCAFDAVTIGYMVVSIGLSLLAGLLLKPKNKSPIQDDKPTTLTTRGSYMNWFIGVRQVGPVFAWAGDREKKKEKGSGGKGGGTPKQDVWYEAGWHQLGVGPLDALHHIVEGGKVIFSGPITRTSHPSGSTVTIDDAQSFTIYWGEVDQPVNSFLGASNRVNVTSRWPFCAYIVWNKKRLGSSPQWQILDYIVERRPSGDFLSQSEPWYSPTQTLDGPTASIIGRVSSSNPDTGYLEVADDFTQELDPGRPVRVTGNALPDGDYTVRRATTVQVVIGTNPLNGLPIYGIRTRIFLETGTLGANIAGSVQTYSFSTDDGANIAHATADLLFADYPQGLQLDPSGPESWDLESLEALGVEAETEGWRASIIGVDGETAQAILGAILQDHGTMLPIDPSTGNMLFQRCREPVGVLPNISVDHEAESLPEVETLHGEKPVDQMVFAFTDRDHGYSDMTIAVDEDGQVSYMEHARPQKVSISSTVHFTTAGALSELRSQEELAGGGVVKLQANRGARHLIPGEAIVCASFDEVMRVSAVSVDPLSETVQLELIPDFYGARKSDFVNEQGGGTPILENPEQDLQFAALEIPEQLLSTEEMFVQVPRIRAHAQITDAAIHLSRDNSTYTQIGTETGVATGGLLDVAMSATGKNFLVQGPTFELKGPDIATAQDLSSDPTNFGLGRQLVAIVSTAGIEICYVEKLTAVSGSQYRLDGLLRARFDTRKVAHPIGAQVYVFSDTTFEAFDDILLVPGEDLYTKSQPFTPGGTVALSAIPPYADTLYGKGVVPIMPENLHVTAPFKGVSVYRTGDDVTAKWNWSSAQSSNTGAGFQNAGTAIGLPVLKGAFIVELLTMADAVVETDTVNVAQKTYSAATLAAAPISNGNFKVRVSHSYNGYITNTVTFTVTHIA